MPVAQAMAKASEVVHTEVANGYHGALKSESQCIACLSLVMSYLE